MKKLQSSDFKPLVEWTDILEELTKVSPSMSGTLAGSRAFVCGNLMLVDTQNRFFLRLFKIKENSKLLNDAVVRVMGKPYALRARGPAAQEEEQKADMLIEKAMSSGIDTTVE